MYKSILNSLFFCLLVACAQENTDIAIGQRLLIDSQVLGEDRPYWVYVPESYNDETYSLIKYPVLYLLDGDAHFHSVTGVVQFMSSGINGNTQIPEMIVVAIPNTDRWRDLSPTHSTVDLDGSEMPFSESSGGGDEFLQFIEDELQPKIDSTYRTRPLNVLVGHSLGGLLAAHAVLEPKQIFQAYIAIDPSLWWDDREIVRRTESMLQGTKSLTGQVYLSLANTVGPSFDPELFKDPVSDFAALLQSAESPQFRSMLEYYPAENHGSVPLLSLYNGLLYIFDGYKPPLELFFGDTSAIIAHFEELSDRLGVTLLPPENLINEMGYMMLYAEQRVGQAIELLTLNTTVYPDSFNAYDSLGEAFMVNGNVLAAIANYERSLELNPENENAVEQLAALREQQQTE
jgi:predicted alpha/beta superfamily hydrolase